MAETDDIQALTFEQALAELEGIVGELESGRAPLEAANMGIFLEPHEDSIRLYERGAKLKAHCEQRLEAARLRVEKIVVGAQGPQGTQPAEFG